MKILIIGCNGQLGTDMTKAVKNEGYDVAALDFPEIDLTNKEMTLTQLRHHNPEIIINCSAYTAVDLCETNAQTAFALNADAVGTIASWAYQHKATLVHFSTDYVFNGMGNKPYVETDQPDPKTIYGKSKLAGEELIKNIGPNYFIFRIAWLYGFHGVNFVKTIKSLGYKNRGSSIKVVNDQFGTPTSCDAVCKQTISILNTSHYGLYHSTCEGYCSWFDFANEIIKASGYDTKVVPCTTAEFPRPAPRPAFSVLENEALKKINSNKMEDWKIAFNEFVQRYWEILD